MRFDSDELAGIVDLLGPLTEAELADAAHEAAFREGTVDELAVEADLAEALERWALVRVPADRHDGAGTGDGEPLLVVGPTAFPVVPPGGEDLPHILDLPPRGGLRAAAAATVRERFERAVETAIDAEDADRAADLLDLSYDLDAWAGIDVAAERERLDALLD